MKRISLVIALSLNLLLVGCTTAELVKSLVFSNPEETAYKKNQKLYKVGNPYSIDGKWYYPERDESYQETGTASWYGSEFHNKKTANGELFNKNNLTAAHRTLPMPSIVKITNLENGRTLLVKVNDRGPFAKNRIIDVSEKAASLLGFKENGTAKVKVEYDRSATARLFYKPGDKWQERQAEKQIASVEQKIERVEPKLPKSISERSFVQTGAYSSYDNAKKIAHNLRGLSGSIVETVRLSDKILYRVKLGPFDTVSDADRMVRKVSELGFNDAVIVAD